MLAQFLALTIAFASFSLYMAAFFFPEVHRKYDLVWSGVGMFYALVLWVCAGRITGGVLLGQTASVALLGWLGWQTLSLRRSLTPLDQQTLLPGSAKTIGEAVQIKLKELRGPNLPQPLAGGLTKAQAWVQRLARPAPARRAPTRSRPLSDRMPIADEVPETVAASAELAVAEVGDVRDEAAAAERTEHVESAEHTEHKAAETDRPAAPLPARAVTRQQQNPFANLRDRLQGKAPVQKTRKQRLAAPSPAFDDFDEGGAGEMVEMTAELEVIEVVEAVEIASIADTAVSDDAPILESDNVIAADAIVEEELQWEASAPAEDSESI